MMVTGLRHQPQPAAHHRFRGCAPSSFHLRIPSACPRWRADELRAEQRRDILEYRNRACRPHPARCQARRFAGTETQPSSTLVINLKTAKVLGLTIPPSKLRASNRDHRITTLFAAANEFLVGTKRTCGNSLTMSASGGRTDLPFKWGHFRFLTLIGHRPGQNPGPIPCRFRLVTWSQSARLRRLQKAWSSWGAHATAGIHQAHGRCGGRVAGDCPRAAVGDARDRFHEISVRPDRSWRPLFGKA